MSEDSIAPLVPLSYLDYICTKTLLITGNVQKIGITPLI